MSYTKGPWLLEENKINGTINIVSESRYFIISSTIDSDVIGERIDKANLKLIAASPDLLEALNKAPIVSKYSNAEEFITAYEKWRDEYKLPAIKKAEGEL